MTSLPVYDQPFEINTEPHILLSKDIIKEAIENSNTSNVVVLGCGRCAEIPIKLIHDRFNVIDLVDIDAEALKSIEKILQPNNTINDNLNFYNADLTRMISNVNEASEPIVANHNNPMSCLRHLGELLHTASAKFWKPPNEKNYDLVICSMVLSQLQASVRESVEKIFLNRFPEYLAALTSDKIWSKSLWTFARKLEDSFINHLSELVKPDGIIYLSATVHASWVFQNDDQALLTEGSWITTKTAHLSDYLNNNSEIISSRRWNWLRQETEGIYWGRLYGVQAIVYRHLID